MKGKGIQDCQEKSGEALGEMARLEAQCRTQGVGTAAMGGKNSEKIRNEARASDQARANDTEYECGRKPNA